MGTPDTQKGTSELLDQSKKPTTQLWGEMITDKINPKKIININKEIGNNINGNIELNDEPMEEEEYDYMDDDDDDISPDDEEGSGESQEEEKPPILKQEQNKNEPLEIETLIRTAYKPEGPKVIFPYRIITDGDCIEDEELSFEHYRRNDIIHHTILLNEHYKKMNSLLQIAINNKNSIDFIKFPPIPDMVIRKRKYKTFKKFKFQIPFNQDQNPYLEKKTIQKMLQKSVVIILAQLGIDKAAKSVVLVLVDVIKEYLRKICLTCNTYCQWDLTKGHINFRAIIDKALVDMGLRNGQQDIQDYCNDIIRLRNKAFRRTFHLVRLYLKTVYANRLKQRLLGNIGSGSGNTATSTTSKLKQYNTKTMLPQQGLSVYLPRGMQTITVMERGRPFVKKYPNYPSIAPAPMLASRFIANYPIKVNKTILQPELSSILRPIDTSDQ